MAYLTESALLIEGASHSFGQTVALKDASLRVSEGSLHAVLGENGAGKSTLMRIVFGLLQPDEARMELHGRHYSPASPADALAHGIGMVHQHFTLVPAMTVAENVALGGRGSFHPRKAEAHVRELCERTGLRLDPTATARDLSIAARQRVEILKALSRGATLLILDEPTAVLAPADVSDLQHWLRSYVEQGNTAVLITHKLHEALAVADDVTVLRRGATVLAAPAESVDRSGLIRAIIGAGDERGELEAELGAEADSSVHATPPSESRGTAAGHTAAGTDADAHAGADSETEAETDAGEADENAPIVAKKLRLLRPDGSVAVEDASVTVRGGEILGIAAVEGSGEYELLRALAGRLLPASGTLKVPTAVGFVPEDRHRDALILNFTLRENVGLGQSGRSDGRIPWGDLQERTENLLAEHEVNSTGPEQLAGALSGGNQQRLVLGRELASGVSALVLENPTRGLDVRAAAALHERLRAVRDDGVAVVLYSSDLDEVLSLADRIVVMHAGRSREVPPQRDLVGRALVG